MVWRKARLALAASLTIGGISTAWIAGRTQAGAVGQAGPAAALLVGFQQAVVAAPTYVYGHGAQGFGFYPATVQPRVQPGQVAPQAAPTPRATSGTAPRRHREFGTGRTVPLAKPWLNQFR